MDGGDSNDVAQGGAPVYLRKQQDEQRVERRQGGGSLDGLGEGEKRGRRTRRTRAPQSAEGMAESVASRRHGARAAKLPAELRRQRVRFAEFFQALYNDIGLSNAQIRDAIVLHYAQMYREDGMGLTEANAAAEEIAIGETTISRM